MADANKITDIETKNITKVTKIKSNKIARMGNSIVKFEVVPQGIIVFFNDTQANIPAGWQAYNSANNRMLIGAGGSYAPTTSGGSAYNAAVGNVFGYTGSGGSHAGSLHPQSMDHYATGSGWEASGTAGAHTHGVGALKLGQIDRSMFVMMKSTQEHDTFPEKTAMIGTGSISGLSNIRATNKIIGGLTSNTDYNKSATLALGTDGAHSHSGGSHGAGYYHCSNAYYYSNLQSGDHSSNITLQSSEFSMNHKRLLLSIWSNASASFEMAPGMIAMWESLTPPDGWVLCNGSNGTPDLRDHFIQSVASGSESTTTTGNNTVGLSINRTISHTASHHHAQQGYNIYCRVAVYRGTYSWTHSHLVNRTASFSYLPYYYALSFIMKAS